MPRPPDIITFTWRDITCRVEHIRDWKIDGWSRLIVRALNPRRAPLPFAEASDYHVHELDEDDLKAAGDLPPFCLHSWTMRPLHFAMRRRFTAGNRATCSGKIFHQQTDCFEFIAHTVVARGHLPSAGPRSKTRARWHLPHKRNMPGLCGFQEKMP